MFHNLEIRTSYVSLAFLLTVWILIYMNFALVRTVLADDLTKPPATTSNSSVTDNTGISIKPESIYRRMIETISIEPRELISVMGLDWIKHRITDLNIVIRDTSGVDLVQFLKFIYANINYFISIIKDKIRLFENWILRV